MRTLANLLKERRKNLGKTLREAEKDTGISNAYLSQVENGRINQPTPKILRELSEYYEISYQRLLELAGHPIVSPYQGKIRHRISAEFEDLSAAETRELKDYLRFIRSRRRR